MVYADLLLPGSVVADTSLTLGVDCGPAGSPAWMYQTQAIGTDQSLSITGLDNATAAQAAANHTCIAGGEFQGGTDVVSIKRVAGARTTVATAYAMAQFIQDNGMVGGASPGLQNAAATVVRSLITAVSISPGAVPKAAVRVIAK